MLQHLDSKTVMGLSIILVVACGMCAFGKLTAELVDVIKYVGTAFMAVRGIANYAEGKKEQ